MTTTQELQTQLHELTERIERIRAEDKEQRHLQAKSTVAVVDNMGSRVIELELQFKQQSAACDKAEKTTNRILNLLQGDPELDQPGFLKRNTDSMTAINTRLEEIERDKSDSRTHRSQNATIPERVQILEKWKSDMENKVKGASGLARFVWSFAGSIAALAVGGWGLYSWLKSHFTGHP